MTNSLKILAAVFLIAASTQDVIAQEAAAPDKKTANAEADQEKRLVQAQKLMTDGKSAEAIVLIDQTLDYYKAAYPRDKTRYYVARSLNESTRYMLESAVIPDANETRNAAVLDVLWAEAYFLKAYANLELSDVNEAKAAIEQALLLSPLNAKYLIESAEASKLERHWDEAYRLYKEAEAAAEYSPSDEKKSDVSHAMRGQAFVFIEQGKLDEAEKMLKECLKLDADDQRAKEELEYIESLRKK